MWMPSYIMFVIMLAMQSTGWRSDVTRPVDEINILALAYQHTNTDVFCNLSIFDKRVVVLRKVPVSYGCRHDRRP